MPTWAGAVVLDSLIRCRRRRQRFAKRRAFAELEIGKKSTMSWQTVAGGGRASVGAARFCPGLDHLLPRERATARRTALVAGDLLST
jgi:hypothetical protein